MPRFFLFRRRQPLDLVASQLADLQQRSEKPAAESDAAGMLYHLIQAGMTPRKALKLSYDEIKMETQWT